MDRAQASVDEAKEVLKRRRMTIDDKELSLKEREGRILDIRAKLNACSSNKEYQAFLEQIAADEQANNVLSDEILELMDKATEDETNVKSVEEQRDKANSDHAALQDKVNSEKGKLESEVARVTGELEEVESTLPGDVKVEYDRVVKGYGEDALAPVEDNVCGGCFQMITAQMLNELRLHRLVFCKSCGRILYEPEETQVS